MHEGPAGSADKGIKLQLPPDAQKLISTSSFDLYRSREKKEIIIYPTVYQTNQLHVGAADLEKLITENGMSGKALESKEEISERAQLYYRTEHWEVYATTEKIIIKPREYHQGQLVLTFDDLRILRGLSSPR